VTSSQDAPWQSRTPGADAAFEEFVRVRSTHLFRLALAVTGWDKQAAEDVLQVALERAYRHRRALFGGQPPEPYVRKAVVNAAIDWHRLRRRRQEQPLECSANLAVEDSARQLAERDQVVRALTTLAPRQRAVLVLRYWEDLPDELIAATLNCTQGTVRSLASRGLARLRELTDAPPREQPDSVGSNHDD
jgi:RNA polymerase sigma-70 factor (sigma-E family)